MTIDEAIHIMNVIIYMLERQYDTERVEKAVEMAIKALEQLQDVHDTCKNCIEFSEFKQQPCEDCISRESIKQKLQEEHDFFVNAYGGFSNLSQNDKSRVDEIDNCIAMVVNEPSVTPRTNLAETSQDCISRQEVLDVINFEDKWLFDANGHNANTHIAFSGLESRVKALPSVTPERPKGKWIEYKVDIAPHPLHCSLCGFSNHHISNRYMKGFRRCPNCGAEMEDAE